MGSVRALVTGGAGFIGSNLAEALVGRGDDVRVLDNFSTGNRANLEGLDVEVVEGELRSYERVHAAVRGVEVVYHLGALGSVPRSVQDPLTSNAVNVDGLKVDGKVVQQSSAVQTWSRHRSTDAFKGSYDAESSFLTSWHGSRPTLSTLPSPLRSRSVVVA